MKTTVELAQEAGVIEGFDTVHPSIDRLVELVRADQDGKYKWDIHSCGPTCKRYACVAMREAVEAEREECARLCEDADKSTHPADLADAIRTRGNT